MIACTVSDRRLMTNPEKNVWRAFFLLRKNSPSVNVTGEKLGLFFTNLQEREYFQ